MNTDRPSPMNIRAHLGELLKKVPAANDAAPKAVILAGGVATGKTTLRRKEYSRGYVIIDAAEIFDFLSKGDVTLDFPDAFLDELELIGPMLACSAVSNRKNIVTEIIGADVDAVVPLISGLKSVGYRVELIALDCDLEEAVRRNEEPARGISAYFAESFQIRWIIEACRRAG